ncbi:hypothetical protein SGPA1_20378 [Streptomyces misionensis JCM 4497]
MATDAARSGFSAAAAPPAGAPAAHQLAAGRTPSRPAPGTVVPAPAVPGLPRPVRAAPAGAAAPAGPLRPVPAPGTAESGRARRSAARPGPLGSDAAGAPATGARAPGPLRRHRPCASAARRTGRRARGGPDRHRGARSDDHHPGRAADRSGRRGQDQRGPLLGGPPPRTHGPHQPGRRPRMGAFRLRRPPVRLERPLRGPVPAGPPYLRLRRAELPGQRHLLHPGRRRLPGPPGRRPRRLEAPCGPGPAPGRPAARPGRGPGAQRRTHRQPPPHRRGGGPHPRAHGRLVRLGPADHRQLAAGRPGNGTCAGRGPGEGDSQPPELVSTGPSAPARGAPSPSPTRPPKTAQTA